MSETSRLISRPTRRCLPAAAAAVAGLALAFTGPLQGIASATPASPAITIKWSGTTPYVSGSGFTPGGEVKVEVGSGTAVIFSANVAATEPIPPSLICVDGVKPICHEFPGLPGGVVSVALQLPPLGCAVLESAPVTATDLATGRVASTAVEWEGFC
jgi:hypothetical protein